MTTLSFILASIILLTAILTVSVQNPIISVVYLIATFVNTAIYLIINGINFIGISYIIVYVGAILVIFLFVILLFDLRQLITLQSNVKFNNLLLSFAITSIFAFSLLLTTDLYTEFNTLILYNDITSLNYYLHINSIIDTFIFNVLQVESIGYELYTSDAFKLIIISVILLLAMLAVIFLK